MATQETAHQPMVQGNLALKPADDTGLRPSHNGPQFVQKAVSPSSVAQIADPYETGCGQCGETMIFKAPLKSWTKVYCRGCNEFVLVC